MLAASAASLRVVRQTPYFDLNAITEVDDSNYNTQLRYQQFKLGNILLVKQLGIEYPRLISVSAHPGLVRTNLGRDSTFIQLLLFTFSNPLMVMSMQTPEQVTSTQMMLAVIPEYQLVGGAYYEDCKVAQEAESATNLSDAKKIFRLL